MSNLLDVFDGAYLNDRLGTYRPMLDRLIVGLALLGVVVAVHLGVQQARGFEDGCFGVAALDATGAGFDCTAVVASGASTLFGVSNVVWGVLFYASVVALSITALARPAWRLHAKQLRAGAIGAGLLYSGYLVYYQAVEVDAYCALCLTSAGLVAALGVVQAASFFPAKRSSQATMSTRSVKREFTLLTYLIALTGLVAAVDVVYASGRTAGPAAPTAMAISDTTQVAEGCSYDAEKTPVADFEGLVNFQDPMQGNAQAPVTIVEYFDPNCPHCKTMHTVMKKAVEAYGDEARFVYKPMPLWNYSVEQIEALYAADQEGKFIPMLEAQYARQQRGGLSMQQLEDIAREIGMNPDVLTARLEQETHRERVLHQRQRAVEIGVDSTPTLIINGRFIDGQSRTVRCLGAFIDAAAQDAESAAVETSG